MDDPWLDIKRRRVERERAGWVDEIVAVQYG